MDFDELGDKLGHRFKDESLLLRALTHRSLSQEQEKGKRHPHNETLEFLGDAVLSFVVAEEIFLQHPTMQEGGLTQLRAQYVCQDHLALSARQIKLGDMIQTGKTMRGSGPVDLPSVLSDALEALIGAVYLDGGLDVARGFIHKILGPMPTAFAAGKKDKKTQLQEYLQSTCSLTPEYRVLGVSGPAHAPSYEVEVFVKTRVLAQGTGVSKKQASQDAAENALLRIGPLSDAALKVWILESSE